MGPSSFELLRRRVRRDPLGAALAAIAIAFSAWFILAPLFAAKYPPITDLPFHAAESAIYARYFDPTFHFKEQFELHPLAVPYLSMYVVAAGLMRLGLDAVLAIKIAAASMLALLPAGLAVLMRAMKKSALLGVLGLALVWCLITHWGFLNFVGAVGLFCMAVGFAILLVEKPTEGRSIGLGVTMVALFFTHVFRFPFAVCGVVGAAIVLAPITRRVSPIVLPLLPSLILFAVWWFVRPAALDAGLGPMTPHFERSAEIPKYLVGGFVDPAEIQAFSALRRPFATVGLIGLGLTASTRWPRRSTREWARAAAVSFVVVSCALVFAGLYFTLPMQMGAWWFVYPREATAAAFVALALFPDLPRSALLKAPLLAGLLYPLAGVEAVVEKNYASFDRATADFEEILKAIPKAPKLLYLVFDHHGSTRATTPFIHLPAYVQAERGGWLSFHFAVWDASPVAYRSRAQRGAVVPPPVPLRWEWTPEKFDVFKNGAFFDWFLVRSSGPPRPVFAKDRTIVPVAHRGTFWLYKREAPKVGGD